MLHVVPLALLIFISYLTLTKEIFFISNYSFLNNQVIHRRFYNPEVITFFSWLWEFEFFLHLLSLLPFSISPSPLLSFFSKLLLILNHKGPRSFASHSTHIERHRIISWSTLESPCQRWCDFSVLKWLIIFSSSGTQICLLMLYPWANLKLFSVSFYLT